MGFPSPVSLGPSSVARFSSLKSELQDNEPSAVTGALGAQNRKDANVGMQNFKSRFHPVADRPIVGITEKEAAEEFSAVVEGFDATQLAQTAGRTREAAKGWKAGSRCPNGSSLINLARAIPRVRDWLLSMIDVSVPAEGPEAMQAILAGLQLVARQSDADGAMARRLLQQFLKEKNS